MSKKSVYRLICVTDAEANVALCCARPSLCLRFGQDFMNVQRRRPRRSLVLQQPSLETRQALMASEPTKKRFRSLKRFSASFQFSESDEGEMNWNCTEPVLQSHLEQTRLSRHYWAECLQTSRLRFRGVNGRAWPRTWGGEGGLGPVMGTPFSLNLIFFLATRFVFMRYFRVFVGPLLSINRQCSWIFPYIKNVPFTYDSKKNEVLSYIFFIHLFIYIYIYI